MLKFKIKAIFEHNNEEYGYRRVHAELVGAENLRHLAGSSADCGPLAARLRVC
jgi:hypothetical protein